MKRREFVMVLGSAAAVWPLVARSRQPDRVRRIGVMPGSKPSDPEYQSDLKKFEQRLKELGWEHGRNVHVEYRWYGGDARLADDYAAELVSQGMDVILAIGTPAAAALKKHTLTLPIVFTVVTDPVGAGFVQSLAEPGGNLTGFTTFEPSMAGKWLELLKEVAPAIRRVGAVFNPRTASVILMPSAEAVAPSFGLELVPLHAHDASELDRAITLFAQQSRGSLLIFPDSFPITHRQVILELAGRYSLPAIYPFPFFVTDGGLMSYGVPIGRLIFRSVDYLDRILRGTNPSNLPVQQPNQFQFLVNLKAAKALGLTIPPTLLAAADEVIE